MAKNKILFKLVPRLTSSNPYASLVGSPTLEHYQNTTKTSPNAAGTPRNALKHPGTLKTLIISNITLTRCFTN
jgi:hypothetical protein